MVRGDGGHDPCLVQDAHGLEGHVLHLNLASTGQVGAYDGGKALRRQLLRDQVPLGAVVQGHLQVELLCNPHCREDVVHPVHMGLYRNLPVQHGHPALQPEVFLKALPAFRRLPLPFPVGFRFCQLLPQHGSDGHPGGGAFPLAGVIDLGVLPEGHLHGRRGLHHQAVHPPSSCLQEGELAAHHVGAAGAYHGRGDACPDGVVEGGVHGVHRIDRPQIGGDGIHRLVAVVPLHALLLLRDAHVAVGLYQPRHDQAVPGQDDPLALRGMERSIPLSDLRNLSVQGPDIPIPDIRTGHGLNRTTDNIHVNLPDAPQQRHSSDILTAGAPPDPPARRSG